MSSDTRENILEAAHELIVGQATPDASMGKIAREAGVSRQAVYLHFDSRADLMLALVDWIDQGIDIAGQLGGVRQLDGARERLLGLLEAMMRIEPQLYDATVIMEAARQTDDAIAAAYEDRMRARRSDLRDFWQDVADDGLLKSDWTVQKAAEATWAMTAPPAYRTFVVDAGWPLGEWIQFVVNVVESLMLVDD